MSNFKELGDDIVGSVLSGASGPLADLFTPKHGGTTSLRYPMDVEGLGESHFMRFNIIAIAPTKLPSQEVPKDSNSPTESAAGEFLGGLAGAAAGNALGGGLGSFAGGIVGEVAGNFVDDSGLGGALDTGIGAVTEAAGDVVGGALELGSDLVGGAADLAGDALGAIGDAAGDLLGGIAGGISGALPPSAASTFGKISAQAGKLAASVTDSLPLSKDGLQDLLLSNSPFADVVGGTKSKKADIVLYMPVGITETYGASWSGGEMGVVGSVEKALTGEGGTGGILDQVKDAGKGMLGEGLGKIAGQSLGNDKLADKGLKLAGKAINPQFEIFFDKPTQRTFSFDFKMIPRNPSEAQAIQDIVKTFKMYAAPELDSTGAAGRYYNYPCYFQIEYWNADKLHRLKECALTNITVNYSAAGTPGTYYDGAPIQTDVTLSFMESVLLTRQDIRNGY
tara:strand:+ start:4921 stop:6273 length:1353 start_codon:yes stop_codon:yes gene_type:complete